jgi:hypothetical protein
MECVGAVGNDSDLPGGRPGAKMHLKLSNQAKWYCSGAKVHLNTDDVSGNPIWAVLECILAPQ